MKIVGRKIVRTDGRGNTTTTASAANVLATARMLL